VRAASATRQRAHELLTDDAGGDRDTLAELVEQAIAGFVVRHGLSVQEPSGWDPWEHFQLGSIVSMPKLGTNVAAAAAAHALGNVEPYKRGDDRRRRIPRDPLPPPGRSATALEEAERTRLALAARSPAEQAASDLALYEALPDSRFKREKVRAIKARQRDTGGDGIGSTAGGRHTARG
jgi:hypothetical protein